MRQKEKAICTITLIVINVSVFLGITLLGEAGSTIFMMEHGAMYAPYIINGHEYYRLITSMFLHFSIDHLVNNMVMLGALGWNLEMELGHVRFLLVYFGSGIGAGIFSLIANSLKSPLVVSAGASGAVFGLMGALVFIVIWNKGRLKRLNIKGMLIMVVLSLYIGFTDVGVDNIAHIGGLLTGFVLGVILVIEQAVLHKK